MANAVTVPEFLEMIVGEQLNLSVDFTNLIAAGDVISAPVVTITNTSTNEVVTVALIGSPTVSNSVIINVTVNSTYLRKKTNYTALFTCTATGGGTSKTVSALLTIKIIY
jgi:transcriptional regulatory protein LevR